MDANAQMMQSLLLDKIQMLVAENERLLAGSQASSPVDGSKDDERVVELQEQLRVSRETRDAAVIHEELTYRKNDLLTDQQWDQERTSQVLQEMLKEVEHQCQCVETIARQRAVENDALSEQVKKLQAQLAECKRDPAPEAEDETPNDAELMQALTTIEELRKKLRVKVDTPNDVELAQALTTIEELLVKNDALQSELIETNDAPQEELIEKNAEVKENGQEKTKKRPMSSWVEACETAEVKDEPKSSNVTPTLDQTPPVIKRDCGNEDTHCAYTNTVTCSTCIAGKETLSHRAECARNALKNPGSTLTQLKLAQAFMHMLNHADKSQDTSELLYRLSMWKQQQGYASELCVHNNQCWKGTKCTYVHRSKSATLTEVAEQALNKDPRASDNVAKFKQFTCKVSSCNEQFLTRSDLNTHAKDNRYNPRHVMDCREWAKWGECSDRKCQFKHPGDMAKPSAPYLGGYLPHVGRRH